MTEYLWPPEHLREEAAEASLIVLRKLREERIFFYRYPRHKPLQRNFFCCFPQSLAFNYNKHFYKKCTAMICDLEVLHLPHNLVFGHPTNYSFRSRYTLVRSSSEVLPRTVWIVINSWSKKMQSHGWDFKGSLRQEVMLSALWICSGSLLRDRYSSSWYASRRHFCLHLILFF